MTAPDRIETNRLILRQPQMTDAAAIFERYASDPEVTRFVGWPRHRSIRDTEAFLQFSAQHWEQWPAGPFLILARSDNRLLGSTGLGFDRSDEAMTGYVLAKDAWGHGFATEALQAMVNLSTRLGLARIHAFCHPDHRASWRVLEKCGFSRDLRSARQVEFPNLAAGVLQDAVRYERILDPGQVRSSS